MGQRRDRLDKRLANATITRRTNSAWKNAERQRRRRYMLTLLEKGHYPYTPGVMSWVSTELNKKASEVKPEDIKTLLAQQP